MLAVALVLGILTSGSPGPESLDDPTSGSEEPAIEAGKAAPEGVGTALAAAESVEEMPVAEDNAVQASAVQEPGLPEPPYIEGESELATKQQDIENKVKATARLLESQGEELFPDLREEDSAWFHDDFYIFVWNTSGTQVVYPPDSASEGKDMKGLMDAGGKPIGELFIETALSKEGEGWIDYSWKKTKSSELSRKYTFVKRASVEGRSYLVGTSFYADDYIISRNLDECEYLDDPGNIHVTELLHPKNFNRDLGIDYSVAHSIIEPGEHIEPHLMKNPEVHYVLEGEGLLYIDDIPVELRPDQLVYIPAGAVQATYNTGNTTLEFLAINQPAWSEKNTEVFD